MPDVCIGIRIGCDTSVRIPRQSTATRCPVDSRGVTHCRYRRCCSLPGFPGSTFLENGNAAVVSEPGQAETRVEVGDAEGSVRGRVDVGVDVGWDEFLEGSGRTSRKSADAPPQWRVASRPGPGSGPSSQPNGSSSIFVALAVPPWLPQSTLPVRLTMVTSTHQARPVIVVFHQIRYEASTFARTCVRQARICAIAFRGSFGAPAARPHRNQARNTRSICRFPNWAARTSGET